MNKFLGAERERRAVIKNGLVLAGALAVPGAVSAAGRAQLEGMKLPMPAGRPATVPAAPIVNSRAVRPDLMRRALAALDRQGGRVGRRDRIAIADFAAPSSQKRFHLVDLVDGSTTSFLVAHGSGSDPSHSGWLSRFSNQPGSNASCEGAFVTDDYYVGKHGRSQRLVGLDPTNNNALSRAIVVHAAWYSNPDMLKTHGMLGRSQGCFAVGDADLPRVFDRLGPGRMIFATKA
ncbi:L,D-transpeptidase catalytic domain [Sphingomonas gellani]|uniref:L,D-transpeptidase catalytic domain n=1 Tax=Sphingomonas gellani TaxID=1166340 RepID=A0A1H7YM08_9SPHN|nr:murein L,D-transpeptidase catalytic domain family protein [Sphingomonas gellani]SEM46971.1 L,D-transpeptidase catalytic domain [Sphingomonas gellani]